MSNLNNKADVLDEFTQKCVDDMYIDSLINTAYDSIYERLDDLPDNDIINEIEESTYDSNMEVV